MKVIGGKTDTSFSFNSVIKEGNYDSLFVTEIGERHQGEVDLDKEFQRIGKSTYNQWIKDNDDYITFNCGKVKSKGNSGKRVTVLKRNVGYDSYNNVYISLPHFYRYVSPFLKKVGGSILLDPLLRAFITIISDTIDGEVAVKLVRDFKQDYILKYRIAWDTELQMFVKTSIVSGKLLPYLDYAVSGDISSDRYILGGNLIASVLAFLIKWINEDNSRLEKLKEMMWDSIKTLPVESTKRRILEHLTVDTLRTAGYLCISRVSVLHPEARVRSIASGRGKVSAIDKRYSLIQKEASYTKSLRGTSNLKMIIKSMQRLDKELDYLFDKEDSRVASAKSLLEVLSGKEGFIRSNILGKRLDYTGRAVITTNPTLSINECGLPMSIFKKLDSKTKNMTRKEYILYLVDLAGMSEASKARASLQEKIDFIRRHSRRVTEQLREKIPYVILDRQPTLHILSLLSFQPVLCVDNAIELCPLVCSGFNADHDGDTMAVTILAITSEDLRDNISELYRYQSDEARSQRVKEVNSERDGVLSDFKNLMAANRNIFAPSNGELQILMRQEMVYGLMYLTSNINLENGRDITSEVGTITYDDFEKRDYLLDSPGRFSEVRWGEYSLMDKLTNNTFKRDDYIVEGNVRRAIGPYLIYKLLSEGNSPEFNNMISRTDESKEPLSDLESKKLKSLLKKYQESLYSYNRKSSSSIEDVAEIFTRAMKYLMMVGYAGATIGSPGLSILTDYSYIDEIKDPWGETIEEKIRELSEQLRLGAINSKTYNNLIGQINQTVSNSVKSAVSEMDEKWANKYKGYNKKNGFLKFARAGARGDDSNVEMIFISKGNVKKNSEDALTLPIRESYIMGQTPLGYHVSSGGARLDMISKIKGPADTGYANRLMFYGCGNQVGKPDHTCSHHVFTIKRSFIDIFAQDIENGTDLNDKALFLLKSILKNKKIPGKSGYYTESYIESLFKEDSNRSWDVHMVHSCDVGVCPTCYGLNTVTRAPLGVGTGIGYLAGQTIGEKSTQGTMKKFHSGGADTEVKTKASPFNLLKWLIWQTSKHLVREPGNVTGTVAEYLGFKKDKIKDLLEYSQSTGSVFIASDCLEAVNKEVKHDTLMQIVFAHALSLYISYDGVGKFAFSLFEVLAASMFYVYNKETGKYLTLFEYNSQYKVLDKDNKGGKNLKFRCVPVDDIHSISDDILESISVERIKENLSKLIFLNTTVDTVTRENSNMSKLMTGSVPEIGSYYDSYVTSRKQFPHEDWS